MDAGGSQGKEKKKKGHMEITWKLEIKINFAHCLFNTCIEKKNNTEHLVLYFPLPASN